jgi:hypothetical protein
MTRRLARTGIQPEVVSNLFEQVYLQVNLTQLLDLLFGASAMISARGETFFEYA